MQGEAGGVPSHRSERLKARKGEQNDEWAENKDDAGFHHTVLKF
jgi:hypothetical protein